MIATVDIEGTVDGGPFITKQSSVQISLYPPLDRDEELLDFSEPLMGLKAGEDKTFTLQVPATERYGDFAGKPAEFQVHLISLQKRELPALDDSLAQTAGDYETLDALKNEIRGELLEAAKRETDNTYSDECVDALVKQATVEFPPQMIKSQIDDLYEHTERRMKEQKMDMAQYLEMLGKTEEQYREELRPTAEVRLRRGLALAELTKVESITVDDEAIDQQIDRLAAAYGPQSKEARKAFSSEGARESIKIDLITQAGLTRLMAICKGEAQADRPVDTL